MSLHPETRDLLRGAREDFEATTDERARIDRALAARLGVAGGTVAATTSVTKAAAGTGAVGGAGVGVATPAFLAGAKWAGVVLLASALGAGGVAVVRSERGAVKAPAVSAVVPTPPTVKASPPPPLPALVDPRAAPTEEAAGAPATPASLGSPSTREISPRSRAAVQDEPPVATVAEETRLLRRADESLRDGDALRALALLDEHGREFPHGVLSEERSAERVLTLCKLARRAEARDEAARFLRRTPDSPLAAGVRASCGGSGG